MQIVLTSYKYWSHSLLEIFYVFKQLFLVHQLPQVQVQDLHPLRTQVHHKNKKV